MTNLHTTVDALINTTIDRLGLTPQIAKKTGDVIEKTQKEAELKLSVTEVVPSTTSKIEGEKNQILTLETAKTNSHLENMRTLRNGLSTRGTEMIDTDVAEVVATLEEISTPVGTTKIICSVSTDSSKRESAASESVMKIGAMLFQPSHLKSLTKSLVGSKIVLTLDLDNTMMIKCNKDLLTRLPLKRRTNGKVKHKAKM